MGKRKSYDELTFTDDFMFREVMQKHPEICRELAELLTGRKIWKIRLPEVQKDEKFLYGGRGVRFDVYFEDAANTVYDIEMQTVVRESVKKRSRYYSSMLDMDHLQRNASYSKLPDAYIVFICLEDPFENNVARYTFRYTCEELPDLKLDDGSTIIFINSKGQNGASPELQAFLEYLNGNLPESYLTKAIDQAVRDQKDDERGRRKYMTLQEHLDEEREEGREDISFVMKNLLNAGRIEDAKRAVDDSKYMDQLLQEFGRKEPVQ